MAEIKQQTTTANSKPETTKEYTWITLEEAAKFQKLLNKRYVPKGDVKFAKKFFWQVISIIPYTPKGAGGPEDHRYDILLQLFRRDKTTTVSKADSSGNISEVECNMRVEKSDGIPETLPVDSEKFKAEFEPDSEMD